jgi:beta-lactamase superfamily II metal-dependent hydrolase
MRWDNSIDWQKNKELHIWIFNVERGFSAFIRTPHNLSIMVDCGCTVDFHPFRDFIKPKLIPFLDLHTEKHVLPGKNYRPSRLAQLIVSHPHIDHFREFQNIKNVCNPFLLTTPHSNPDPKADTEEHVNWDLVKNPEGSDEALEFLKQDINKRDPPLRTILITKDIHVPGFSYNIFYNKAKQIEKMLPKENYGNNLSLLVHITMGNNSILFPGDIMPDGLIYLMKNNKDFVSDLSGGLTFLVASHHGLESGYCKEFFDILPQKKVKGCIIISEKSFTDEAQGKIHPNYQNDIHSTGIGGRYSLTTRKDGHIYICMGTGNKCEVVCSNWKNSGNTPFPEEKKTQETS